MNDCINRPDTRLHPTNASEPQFVTCNAGAIHTGQAASLITGGTSGIGLAGAKRIVSEAGTVIVTGLNQARMNDAQAALDGPGQVIANDTAVTALAEAASTAGGLDAWER
ncbi:SDR family oxidoreductase [Methylobacterium flocculans]|uniref:hypothetical protein n=1 Tax=Methylobacterium flocculans TaxID=2984843 RepID=UPI0021F3019A|nr:hypothetical protein [Methylobacterium sp. FF17]